MSRRRRRHFSSTEKVESVKRHCLEGIAVSQICEELKIHPTMFYEWQRRLFENGVKAFETESGKTESKELREKTEALEAKLQRKDSVLAELMEEHITLKKSLGEL